MAVEETVAGELGTVAVERVAETQTVVETETQKVVETGTVVVEMRWVEAETETQEAVVVMETVEEETETQAAVVETTQSAVVDSASRRLERKYCLQTCKEKMKGWQEHSHQT